MSQNIEKMVEFKTELDKVIASLNKMSDVWYFANESEEDQLADKYPFSLSFDEQIAEIEEWRNNIVEITNTEEQNKG